MQASAGAVVRAETLTAAAVSAPTLAALRALRTGRPCSAVKWRNAGGLTPSHSVYDASSLGMGFVMFARGGTPVVVGLADAPAPAPAPPAPEPAASDEESEGIPERLIDGIRILHVLSSEPAPPTGLAAPPVAAPPVAAPAPAPQSAAEAAEDTADAACTATPGCVGGGPKRGKVEPPLPAPVSTDPAAVITAAAAADMLFLHAATAEGPLAPYARTLKTACYERHAASLAVAPRALLAALRDESSPGVFALAAELAFV